MSLVLKRELWVGTKKKIGREGGREAGGVKIVILYTSTFTQIPKKINDISKQHSQQAIRQGKLRKITKCSLTRFSYSVTLGRHVVLVIAITKCQRARILHIRTRCSIRLEM